MKINKIRQLDSERSSEEVWSDQRRNLHLANDSQLAGKVPCTWISPAVHEPSSIKSCIITIGISCKNLAAQPVLTQSN